MECVSLHVRTANPRLCEPALSHLFLPRNWVTYLKYVEESGYCRARVAVCIGPTVLAYGHMFLPMSWIDG